MGNNREGEEKGVGKPCFTTEDKHNQPDCLHVTDSTPPKLPDIPRNHLGMLPLGFSFSVFS